MYLELLYRRLDSHHSCLTTLHLLGTLCRKMIRPEKKRVGIVCFQQNVMLICLDTLPKNQQHNPTYVYIYLIVYIIYIVNIV